MYQTLKGFRDFIGVDARRRAWLIQIMREVCEAYGFEPLETPALEYEELLLGKYGPEAAKLIYGFEDRGGRRVALRYDQTVPTARVIAQYRGQLTLPYKRYQIQPVWRADKPQKGRYREFTQSDMDIVGAQAPLPDAIILTMVSAVCTALGLRVTIKINDRSQLMGLIESAGIPRESAPSVIQTIDKLDKKSTEEVITELRERGVTSEQADRLFSSFGSATPVGSLAAIIDLAHGMGVRRDTIVFTPSLARGLDYYTGMIFEVVVSDYAGGSIGGGGRYDRLIADLVGVDMPAVGMAFGFDRLVDVLTDLGKFPTDILQSASVLVAIQSPESLSYSAQIAATLQAAGVRVELYPDSTRKLETQLKYALARSIPMMVIAGESERARGVLQLKDLSTRAQEELTIEQAVRKIRK